MTRTFARAGAVLAGLALAVGAALIGATPAAADSAPFSDPYATGYLGFCDQHGNQIRSGSTGVAPFAWRVVSSQAAPSGYGPAQGGRGTLAIYQPRKGVDPYDWSGKQMTASSPFSNAGAPMAAGTPLDPALVDFAAAYPLEWDGYAELRLLFTAPKAPQHTRTYPAAVIRVTGNTWTQVGGGPVNCRAGQVISPETIGVPARTIQSLAARSTPGATAPAGGGTSPSPGASGSGSPTTASGAPASGAGAPAGGSGSSGALTSAAPHAAAKTSSSSAGLWWVVAAAVAIAGSVAALLRRRRRA